MAKPIKRTAPKRAAGFKRNILVDEKEGKAKIAEQNEKIMTDLQKLTEKFSAQDDLSLPKEKIEEIAHESEVKAYNLLKFMENTEKAAKSNRTLHENKLQEEIADSDFLGITPVDIVKIVRLAYPNSVAQEMFDFWSMGSMKDSIYKLETEYGAVNQTDGGSADTTPRGATAGGVINETYNDGRYPSENEHFTVSGTTTSTDTYSDTLEYVPLVPFQVSVYLEGEQVAVDDGNGNLVGSGLTGTNTIDYTTGDFTVTFTGGTITTGDELIISYFRDSEKEDNFFRTGSVVLNLVEYAFRARPWPLAIEWTRMMELLMDSKLGMSGKDMLLTGSADAFRKSMDEYCIAKGIRASNWTSAVTFNADYGAVGSDSATEHAQGVLAKIIEAEYKTYDDLGRKADKSNLLVDSTTYAYLTKHKRFNAETPASSMGIHKVGSLDGRGVYVAPSSIISAPTGSGYVYIFGKGNDPMSTDAVVSVGTYKASISTNPVEFKNFNSEMGLAMVGDIKTNNRKFATAVEITNIANG